MLANSRGSMFCILAAAVDHSRYNQTLTLLYCAFCDAHLRAVRVSQSICSLIRPRKLFVTTVDPSMHFPKVRFRFGKWVCRRGGSVSVVVCSRYSRVVRGSAGRSFVARADGGRPRLIARYCRAPAPPPPSCARNLRPQATSNHLFIEHSSNSGNISRHFAQCVCGC